MQKVGVYLHVPFCAGKCPYCDFFSLRGNMEMYDNYTNCIIERIKKYKLEYPALQADTLYFGGGTPSLLGAKRLCRILEAARRAFGLEKAEITLEANPDRDLAPLLREVGGAGVNRVSLGLQSAVETEQKALGRRHTAEDAARSVDAARAAGISRISLDLMLGIPGQTMESLKKSVQFCLQTGVTHLSAYLLRIEPRTAFWQRREQLQLPDDEQTAAFYETAGALLETAGLRQYEISNFAQPGEESRHNFKYWNLAPYLGLGPGAHSYFGGRRFFYPRSLRGFLAGEAPQPEEDAQIPAGSFLEYAMLRLRLAEGLTEEGCQRRFGCSIPAAMRRAARRYVAAGLVQQDAASVRLTRRGFLVSNALLGELLFAED